MAMLVLLTLLKKQTRTPSNPELLGGKKNNSRNNNKKPIPLHFHFDILQEHPTLPKTESTNSGTAEKAQLD